MQLFIDNGDNLYLSTDNPVPDLDKSVPHMAMPGILASPVSVSISSMFRNEAQRHLHPSTSSGTF